MFKKILPISLLIIISVLFLTNCEENEENTFQVEHQKLPLPLANENSQGEEIEPGAHCFENKKNIQNTKTAQLLIAYDYSVTGVIENLNNVQTKQFNNDDLEYREFVAGVLNESELEVIINREKEDRNKGRKETWLLTLNSLTTSQETYEKINCEKLIN
jgi:hypothetical protein